MSSLHARNGENAPVSRRGFLRSAAAGSLALGGLAARGKAATAEDAKPFFQTRGVVLVPSDVTTWDWPEQAKRAGLSTIGTHIFPHQVAEFVQTDEGRRFLERCRKLGIEVEHELHSIGDLLPRELFERDATMFRMNESGDRVADCNLCVHSKAAVEVACENAQKYARLLRPTTGRYFYWIDDGRPMCHCPQCRGLSDSDQALVLENGMLRALREIDPRATLAHLAYANTYRAPTQVKPTEGIFLEFAPIHRNYDVPFSRRDSQFGAYTHGQLLDDLDANLEVFGSRGAQALEYWLDESRFLRHLKPPRPERVKIPWSREVFRADLETYAKRGIRHVTTFAVKVDGPYIKHFGRPPLDEYGADLSDWPELG
ncbi:MAG TPA: DUF4838 domain-containing protein [Thermoguttaceae bacterium]|nr:DUF4838 domain-containing protein [Thermoguttaceae bacterium]